MSYTATDEYDDVRMVFFKNQNTIIKPKEIP